MTRLEEKFTTINCNLAKEIIIDKLLKDNVLTEDQAYLYKEDYQIIIIEKTWYVKWFNRIFKNHQRQSGSILNYVKFNP